MFKSRNSSKVHQNFPRHESSFLPKRILVITKISKYQHLKLEYPHLNESQLKEKLLALCIDYNASYSSHQQHKETQSRLVQLLENLNIEFRIKDK